MLGPILKDLLMKIFSERDKVTISFKMFKLHSKCSVLFFMSCTLLMFMSDFNADPASCAPGNVAGFSAKDVTTYCWNQGFIIRRSSTARNRNQKPNTYFKNDDYAYIQGNGYYQKVNPDYIRNVRYNDHLGPPQEYTDIYPGVGTDLPDDEHVSTSYMHWAKIVIFFHGAVFVMLECMWNCLENGKMGKLLQDLRNKQAKAQRNTDQVKSCVAMLLSDKHHDRYAFSYYFCELLALVIYGCLFMYLNYYFPNGSFLTLGYDVIKHEWLKNTEDSHPLLVLIPTHFKCLYNSFGPSGTVQKHDILCNFNSYMMMQRVYLATWFWLLACSFVTAVSIMINVCVLLKACIGRKTPHGFGMRFTLQLLKINLDLLLFSQLLEQLKSRQEVKHQDIEKQSTPKKKQPQTPIKTPFKDQKKPHTPMKTPFKDQTPPQSALGINFSAPALF